MASSLYPTSFTADPVAIETLQSLYQTAYDEILSEMQSATSFGVARRKQLLVQVDSILADLQTAAEDVIDEEITNAYKSGGADAVRQLLHIGADVSSAQSFDSIHQDAVRALVSDTARSFADSVQAMGRSTQGVLSDAVKAQIRERLAVGTVKGDTLRNIKKDVIGTLQSDGITALRDKAGRTWSFDRYSEMLIRTKATEARNTALVNRMIENGYDLAQVSAHGATDQCRAWEGKIISVDGKTEGYPTLADAELGGLFHPNCRHTVNTLIPDLASQTEAYNGLVDTVTGNDFVDEVDQKYKGAYMPPDQIPRPKR